MGVAGAAGARPLIPLVLEDWRLDLLEDELLLLELLDELLAVVGTVKIPMA